MHEPDKHKLWAEDALYRAVMFAKLRDWPAARRELVEALAHGQLSTDPDGAEMCDAIRTLMEMTLPRKPT